MVFHNRYTGRGLFLNPPTVFLSNNTWNLSLPEGMQSNNLKFANISESLSFCLLSLLSIKLSLMYHQLFIVTDQGTICLNMLILLQPSVQKMKFLIQAGTSQIWQRFIHHI